MDDYKINKSFSFPYRSRCPYCGKIPEIKTYNLGGIPRIHNKKNLKIFPSKNKISKLYNTYVGSFNRKIKANRPLSVKFHKNMTTEYYEGDYIIIHINGIYCCRHSYQWLFNYDESDYVESNNRRSRYRSK